MSRSISPSTSLEALSRYILLGSAAEGRHVLDIGAGTAAGALQLIEAGAESVTVVSERPEQVERDLLEVEVEGVEVLADDGLPLSFEDDAFGLIICHDLTERIVADEAWIEELRRVLQEDGYIALAVSNAAGTFLSELRGERGETGLDYEEAFDRLAEHFGEAALFGQAPVVASLFFDFESEEEDPGLTFDRSLLTDDSEEPGWYLLVFGPEALHRDDLMLVEHPFSEVAQQVASSDVSEAQLDAMVPLAPPIQAAEGEDAGDALRDAIAAREQAEARLAAAEARIDDLVQTEGHYAAAARVLREQEEALRAEVARRYELEETLAQERGAMERARAGASTGEPNELRQSYEALQGEYAELEQRLAELRESRTEVQQEAAQLRDELSNKQTALDAAETMFRQSEERYGEQIRELEQRLAEGAESAEELDEARRARAEAEEQLAGVREARAQADERLAQMEQQLSEAEQARAAAEQQLAEAQNAAERARGEAEELRAQLGQSQEQLGQTQEQLEQAKASAAEQLTESEAQAQEELDRLSAEVEHAREAQRAAEQKLAGAEQEREQAGDLHQTLEAEKKARIDAEAQAEQVQEELGAARTELEQSQRELARVRQDSGSFETQIKDLLEETAQLRQSETAAKQERDAAEQARQQLAAQVEELSRGQSATQSEQNEALQQERQRAEKLLGEVARLKMRLKDLEVERDQAVEAAQSAQASAAQAPAQASTAPAAESQEGHQPAPSPKRDAVGRQLESSLEEIEDLLTTAVPNRRP